MQAREDARRALKLRNAKARMVLKKLEVLRGVGRERCK